MYNGKIKQQFITKYAFIQLLTFMYFKEFPEIIHLLENT